MSKNKTLSAAKSEKNDECYTRDVCFWYNSGKEAVVP